MESSSGLHPEEVILTDPESEEVDEDFYTNRLLMLGTTVAPCSPPRYSNSVSLYDTGISPQITVLPRKRPSRLLENDQISDNQVNTSVSQKHAGSKDDENFSDVDHMTEVVGPGNTVLTPKDGGTQTKSVCNEQNAGPLRRSLRTPRKPDTYTSAVYQESRKSNHSKGRVKCKDKSREGNPRKSASCSHPSTGGQQRLQEELYSRPVIKNPETGKVLSMKSIQRRKSYGESLLHIAVMHGDIQFLEELIKGGVCVNQADNAGWTPLHEAVLHSQYSSVEMLLRAGAEVNPRGYNGITPLQDATVLGNLEIIDLLLKHGADPLLKNLIGEAALDISKDINVQELLRKYLPTTARKCLSAQHESYTISCGESRNKEPCKTGVGQDAQGAEKAHDSSSKTGASPKVTSLSQTVLPQNDQETDYSMHGSLMVHENETLGSDAPSSKASDTESDITVDYIEAHSSSPGHWFLSATQDFSGSIIRVVETTRKDTSTIDDDLQVNQTLGPAANESNPGLSKGSSRDSSDNKMKRGLDVSRDGQESVTRKKIRRITTSSKTDSFLDYLLNFDLSSVLKTSSASGNKIKEGSNGSAFQLNRSVNKDYHLEPDVCQKEAFCEETGASHTQVEKCIVSRLAPCESNSENRFVVDTLNHPFKTVTPLPVPTEGFLESNENGSQPLVSIIDDQGLTSSPELQAGGKLLTVTGEQLKMAHSVSQNSSISDTVQSCFDESQQKQFFLPISNSTIDSSTMENPSEQSQNNIGTQNNLPTRGLLENSDETVISTIMYFEKHCQSDKLDIPTKQLEQREDKSETQLSPHQAYVSPSETNGIVSYEELAGGRTWLTLIEDPPAGILEFQVSPAYETIQPLFTTECSLQDPQDNCNENETITLDNSIPGPSAFTSANDDNADVDDTRCSTDSDCTYIEELAHTKNSDKDGECEITQTSLNVIPVSNTCDKEQYLKQRYLDKALDEQTIGEELENTVDPLYTQNSPSILTHLELKPIHLYPALDSDQGNKSIQEDDSHIVMENKEISYTDKLSQQKMKRTKKQKNKTMPSTQTKGANAATKQGVKTTRIMLDKNEVGQTNLHLACKKGDLLLVKRLIKAGININISNNAGWTALHEAITAGYIDVVDQLLRAGADSNRTGLEGVTPLHDAVSCGQYEIVKLLLHYGSNPHDKDVIGRSALDLANDESIRELLLTFKGPHVKPIEQTDSTKQGSQILTHEHILDSPVCKPQYGKPHCDIETHMKGNPGSSALYKEMSSQPQTLKEVERKQREMSHWELREPEDGSRFADGLLEMQTVLNDVLFKQKSEKFHLSNKYRTTGSDSFHESKRNKNLLGLAAHQKHLHMLLHKQKELNNKLKMFLDQPCYSTSSTGATELNATQHIQSSDHDCISTNIHPPLESQSVISNVAATSLLSGRTAATDDSRTLSNLIKKGVIQPRENALELALMGSCHKASLLHDGSLRDTGGKVFSIPEHWVSSVLGSTFPVSSDFAWKQVTYGSKPLWDWSSTDSGNQSWKLQEHASNATCTGFPVEESLTQAFMAISSIHLISDDEFLPCYEMDRYWNVFIQNEDWVF